jgi:hypothetical protein
MHQLHGFMTFCIFSPIADIEMESYINQIFALARPFFRIGSLRTKINLKRVGGILDVTSIKTTADDLCKE